MQQYSKITMLNKALSLMAMGLGIIVALKYFNIYDISGIFPYNISMIGALFLILMQLLSYMLVHISNQGTTIMGKLIKTVLAVPGIIYIVNIWHPLSLGLDLEIIIAVFLFTEGIYGLH